MAEEGDGAEADRKEKQQQRKGRRGREGGRDFILLF